MGFVNEKNENIHASIVTSLALVFAIYSTIHSWDIYVEPQLSGASAAKVIFAAIFLTLTQWGLVVIFIKIIAWLINLIFSFYNAKLTSRTIYSYIGYIFFTLVVISNLI